MPILNYSTTVPVHKTLGEIQHGLAKAGARSISIDYDDQGEASALTFVVVVKAFPVQFRLPTRHDGVLKIMLNDPEVRRHMKPTEEQARRVAWRIVKDWVEAQLAIIEAGQAELAEVFLPYAVSPRTGQTMYDEFKSSFLLGSGE